jgi:hypothetical protein
MQPFKFFQKNPHRDRCQLDVGSTFIYRGYYSTITNMYGNGFRYTIQETGFNYYMSYRDYLSTPSAAGRKLNYYR